MKILFQISSQSHLKVCHNNSRGKLENEELLRVAEGHGDSVPGVLGGVGAGPVHRDIELGEGVEQAGVLLSAVLLQGGRRRAGVLTEDDHSVNEEQTSQLLSRVQSHAAGGAGLSECWGKLRPGTHPQCVEAGSGQWPASDDGGTRRGTGDGVMLRPRHRHLRLLQGDTIFDIPAFDVEESSVSIARYLLWALV